MLLHRQLLSRMLGAWDSTANFVVLAELGRFPSHVHWWQQTLRHHNRIQCWVNNLSYDERFIMIKLFCWRHARHVTLVLEPQSLQLAPGSICKFEHWGWLGCESCYWQRQNPNYLQTCHEGSLKPCNQNTSQHLIFEQSSTLRGNSSANMAHIWDVDVMVFMSTLVGFCR